ncbi:hypothetical protein [Pseudonocardia sp. GCM10023141]|uniref:hypothetical protein n=1 Tax=Pseudonocardia sp. GCM10023141 TaxID=3252653 RepID=UPI003618F36B
MARKLDALQGLLDEKPVPAPQRLSATRATATAPVSTPKPQTPVQDDVEADSEPTVRSTLDLAASRHAVLLREAADTGLDVGWPVRPQHLLRAMFDELVDDPAAMARVRDRIRNQGRPVRRRST